MKTTIHSKDSHDDKLHIEPIPYFAGTFGSISLEISPEGLSKIIVPAKDLLAAIKATAEVAKTPKG